MQHRPALAPSRPWSRLTAWLRRGWDAELLACAPATDEQGRPLVWDFPHPVNRTPLFGLLRPWILGPVMVATVILGSSMLIRGRLLTPAELGERLLVIALISAFFGPSIERRYRPKVHRMALRTYRQYRWRGTSALDAAIDEARDTSASR
jgi:hypothetical protein